METGKASAGESEEFIKNADDVAAAYAESEPADESLPAEGTEPDENPLDGSSPDERLEIEEIGGKENPETQAEDEAVA